MEPTELISHLSGEVTKTLSSALDRVVDLASAGRIDRRGLRALRDEIDQARRAGVMAQQLLRLSGGEVQVAREQIDLTLLVRKALQQHEHEITTRGFELRHQLAQVDVASDATLVYAMLQTLLDWSLTHADSRIDLRLDSRGWPSLIRMSCAFVYLHTDEAPATTSAMGRELDPKLNSMAWHLLVQMASVLGLRLQRHDVQGRTQLTIEFQGQGPHRDASLPGLYAREMAPGGGGSQPLAGLHVLLLTQQADLKQQVHEVLRGIGMTLDVASTLTQAQHLGAANPPQAFVYDLALMDIALDIWLQHLSTQNPALATICVDDAAQAFEVLQAEGRRYARISRAALKDALPAALLFELSQAD